MGFFCFHNWDKTAAVYRTALDKDLCLPEKPATRTCTKCGQYQEEDLHLLGLNNRETVSTWVTMEAPDKPKAEDNLVDLGDGQTLCQMLDGRTIKEAILVLKDLERRGFTRTIKLDEVDDITGATVLNLYEQKN